MEECTNMYTYYIYSFYREAQHKRRCELAEELAKLKLDQHRCTLNNEQNEGRGISNVTLVHVMGT